MSGPANGLWSYVEHFLTWLDEASHTPGGEVTIKFLVELSLGGLGVLSFEVGRHIKHNWRKIVVNVKQHLSGWKLVLLWIDVDNTTAQRIANRLRKNLPYVHVQLLNAPHEILLYPLTPSVVEAVALISTDVTKLSSDDRIREEIEKNLEHYILNGGGLVAGHDLIYRRTRNTRLIRAFGIEKVKFDSNRTTPVRYEKTAIGANHPLSRRLPDTFSLDDGEVLLITWKNDAQVQVLFQEAGITGPQRGLVATREYEGGRLVWMNSADHGEELAKSIATPSDQYIDLLAASIQWVTQLKQLAPGAPLIGAHRGASAYGGENTLRAFQVAIDLEADFIECDIRRTQDGVLVLHHDAAVGENTANSLIIADKPFVELQSRATALKRPLATLEELLILAKGHIQLDLELKVTGYEEEIAAMLKQHEWPPDRFVVTSFLESALIRFKECYREAKCGLLIGESKWKWLKDWYPEARLRRTGADFVAAADRLVRFGFARRLSRKHYPVWVWTVNDTLRMSKLLRTPGVEGVISDFVYVAKQEQSKARRL